MISLDVMFCSRNEINASENVVPLSDESEYIQNHHDITIQPVCSLDILPVVILNFLLAL